MRTKPLAVVIVLTLVALPTAALAWGNAAHTWLAQRLGARGGVSNFDEIYGILLPDQYNFLFDPAGQWLALQAHTDVMPVVDLASRCRLRAAAFGFALHNDVWGADYTAHHDGRTTPGEGWVVVKAQMFAPALEPVLADFLVAGGFDPITAAALAAAMTPELSHLLIESATDLVVVESLDGTVGSRMLAASLVRAPGVPTLLADVYAPGLAAALGIPEEEAALLIVGVEEAYRREILIYGKAFCRPPDRVLAFLGRQGATVARTYLEAATGMSLNVPPGLVAGLIRAAADMVAPDVEAELQATLEYLEGEAEAQGVESCWPVKK